MQNAQDAYRIRDVLPGRYDVYLASVPVNYPTGESESPQAKIPNQFNSLESDGLECEVAEGHNQFEVLVP